MSRGTGAAAVVGIDIGGTSTRAVAYGGRHLELVERPGGNPNSSVVGLDEVLRDAVRGLRTAWPALDPRGGVIGLAGGGRRATREVLHLVRDAWTEVGWTTPPSVVSDIEITYWAAAEAVDTLVVFAGTGAGACCLRSGTLVSRSDGLGWLLGDVGSAVWLGIRALQAVAADLDRRAEPTSLTEAVIAELRSLGTGSPSDPLAALVTAVYALRPAQYGAFARLVTAQAADGDPVANRLLDEAADGLVTSARTAVHHDRGARHRIDEVVLGGSVLLDDNPLARRVRRRLDALFGVPTRLADLPVVGALVLAARAAGVPIDRRAVTLELRRRVRSA